MIGFYLTRHETDGFEPRSVCHGGGGGGKGGGGGGAAPAPTIIYEQAPAPDTSWKSGPEKGMSFTQGVIWGAIHNGGAPVFPSTPGTNYNVPPPPPPANKPITANAAAAGQGDSAAARAGASGAPPTATMGALAAQDPNPLGLPQVATANSSILGN